MIRPFKLKMQVKFVICSHQALGYDSTVEKVSAQIDKFNQQDSGHLLCLRRGPNWGIF